MGRFTSDPPRTVSCRTEALPSGIHKRRGWNTFTPLSFLLPSRSFPAAQRILCSPGWLVCGVFGQGEGGRRGGWSCLRSYWWLIHIFYTTDSVGKINAKVWRSSGTKVLLVCFSLTAIVPKQDKRSCFSLISKWFDVRGPGQRACVCLRRPFHSEQRLIVLRRFSHFIVG